MNRRTLLKTGAAAFGGLGAALSVHAESSMPPHFLWGAATAAHQVEGNDVNSDLWLLEHLPDSMFKEPSGDAWDAYHLYEDDIALLADLGLNAYRFSLNWARIEPANGEFSGAELRHYRRILEACHRHQITPIVTFVNLTRPAWFAYNGGWENPASVDPFARYCGRCADAVGELIGWAATFNEPNIMKLLG